MTNDCDKTRKIRGQATIRVRFRSMEDYRNFRLYVLKDGWTTEDNYPPFESMTVMFENSLDLSKIVGTVVMLLQSGYEVQMCRFQLEEQLVELEHPTEEDIEEAPEVGTVFASDDILKFTKDIWQQLGLN